MKSDVENPANKRAADLAWKIVAQLEAAGSCDKPHRATLVIFDVLSADFALRADANAVTVQATAGAMVKRTLRGGI